MLESVALIWWESKTEEDMKKHSNVLSSWNDFFVSLRRQFCPLAYMKKAIIDWKKFRKLKFQSVQSYT